MTEETTHFAVADAHDEWALSWPAVWAFICIFGAAGAWFGQLAHWGARPGQAGLISGICFLVCAVAAGHDAATSRVPNPLTYTAILLGLALNCLPGILRLAGISATDWIGAVGPTQSLMGFGLCAGIGLACIFMAGMGGGDMKLLAGIGAMLGSHQVTRVMFCALGVAVPFALVNLLLAGKLNAILRAGAMNLLSLLYFKRPLAAPGVAKGKIPMALPILIGMVLARTLPVDRYLGL